MFPNPIISPRLGILNPISTAPVLANAPIGSAITSSLTQTLTGLFGELDSNKIMYFTDNRQLSYPDAITLLAGLLSVDEESIESTVKGALTNASAMISSQQSLASADESVLAAFYAWAIYLHNNLLTTAPQASGEPDSIVYDLLQGVLQKQGTLDFTSEDALLLFCLKGLDARKNASGATPHVRRIKMADLLSVIDAVQTLTSAESQAATSFRALAEPLTPFNLLYDTLNTQMTQLQDTDPVFGYLYAQNSFDFETTDINLDTGARIYNLSGAMEAATTALTNRATTIGQSYFILELTALFVVLTNINNGILTDFENGLTEVSETTKSYVLWQASEWLMRMYVAMGAAAGYDETFNESLGSFGIKDFFIETILRRLEGNFPVNDKNTAVSSVELKELFTQEALSATQAVQTFTTQLNS